MNDLKTIVFKYKKVIAILLLILIYVLYRMRMEGFLKDSEKAVGKIYDEYIANTASYIRYRYKVGDVWYDKRIGSEDKQTSNVFYYVKYSKEKPEISQILLDEPVKDTVEIKNAGFKLNE